MGRYGTFSLTKLDQQILIAIAKRITQLQADTVANNPAAKPSESQYLAWFVPAVTTQGRIDRLVAMGYIKLLAARDGNGESIKLEPKAHFAKGQ